MLTSDANATMCFRVSAIHDEMKESMHEIPEQKHDHGGDVDTVYADERTTPFKYKVNDGPNIADFQVIYAEE